MNAFDQKDLVNFEKNKNYLDENKEFEIEYSAEPKIDGISASLIYKKENLLPDYQEEMERKVKI